jgi:hypothetical protein
LLRATLRFAAAALPLLTLLLLVVVAGLTAARDVTLSLIWAVREKENTVRNISIREDPDAIERSESPCVALPQNRPGVGRVARQDPYHVLPTPLATRPASDTVGLTEPADAYSRF